MTTNQPVIIFAERDLAWSRRLRVALRRRGAKVITAGTAQELALNATRCTPDLVVLDDNLDEGDSKVRISLLRDSHPKVEVILLATLLSDVPRGFGLGLLYCGTRSVSRESLLTIICSAIPALERASPEDERPAAKVLCVDDDSFYVNCLSRILARHGYRPSGFDDPERALEALPELQPDLAIIDLMMPGMNGFDLADEIQEISRTNIPIVFLSGRDSDSDILEGYRQGASFYITKPCDPTVVLNAVDFLVGDIDATERKLLELQL